MMKKMITIFATLGLLATGCRSFRNHAIVPAIRVGPLYLSQTATLSSEEHTKLKASGIEAVTNLFGYSTCEIWVTSPDYVTRGSELRVGDVRDKVISTLGTPNYTKEPDGKFGSEILFYEGIEFTIDSNRVNMIAIYPKEGRGQHKFRHVP
jgi:hypothetical protein